MTYDYIVTAVELAVALAFGATVVGLVRLRPDFTDATVLAFVPWVGAAALLALGPQVLALPSAVRPILRVPTAYLVTFAVAGAVWTSASVDGADDRTVARRLAAGGTILLGALAWVALGHHQGAVRPAWPAIAIVVAGALSGGLWLALRRYGARVVVETGHAGHLVVFGHALDGTTTAVGIDALGLAEATTASRAIIEFAGRLPIAAVVGSGWLYVTVKLAFALLAIELIREHVATPSKRSNFLLAIAAFTGLGPGLRNLVLLAVSG